MAAGTSHSFEEHRGELEIRIEAPSLPALFAEAGRALAEVMHATPLAAPAGWSDEIVVNARDREALLVEWLNELVVRSEVAKVLLTLDPHRRQRRAARGCVLRHRGRHEGRERSDAGHGGGLA